MITTASAKGESAEDVRRVLAEVNFVLSEANKYSKEKAKEAEEAATRCRALERVIIEGIGNVDNASKAGDGSDRVDEKDPGISLMVKGLVEKAKVMERQKAREDFSTLSMENKSLKNENTELKGKLKAIRLERDQYKADMDKISTVVKEEAAREWQVKLESSVRAECSRMKAWARGVIDRKELHFKSRLEQELAKKAQEFSSQYRKENRLRGLSVAREAAVEEKIKQKVKRQVEKVKKSLELDLEMLQKELEETKLKLKTVSGERDALKSESRNHRRKVTQKIAKMKVELRAEYEEKSKREVAEHRQGIAKLLQKSARSVAKLSTISSGFSSELNESKPTRINSEREEFATGSVKAPKAIKLSVDVKPSSPAVEYSSSLIASPTPSTPGGFEDCED